MYALQIIIYCILQQKDTVEFYERLFISGLFLFLFEAF